MKYELCNGGVFIIKMSTGIDFIIIVLKRTLISEDFVAKFQILRFWFYLLNLGNWIFRGKFTWDGGDIANLCGWKKLECFWFLVFGFWVLGLCGEHLLFPLSFTPILYLFNLSLYSNFLPIFSPFHFHISSKSRVK